MKEAIAIVGIGCHMPGDINSPEELWERLRQGVNGISDVPADRWNIEEYYDPNPNKAGKIKAKRGGFIKDIDKFDNEFFKIFPKEAERIDPQQRLLLQTTFEAMEDSGDKLEALKGSQTAVYMGVFMNDYWDMQIEQSARQEITPHVPMGVSLTSTANRLSYCFDLKGPSITLDTACSSSLVAIHLACQSIWSKESKAAFAGGVNIMINPESSVMMSKGNFLSPDGACKTFDDRANGYVRSEGSGVIYLKPLSEALKDKNKIYGLIRGTSCNSDGHTSEGFTVPSIPSQAAMLQKAYDEAGVDPKKVQYVEAHGTGTPVGDPIETEAFSRVFSTPERALMMGSIKSNIGHLEGAAGVAGLIKLSMSLKKQEIPGNLHFINPNPKIKLKEWNLKVVAENTPWPAPAEGSRIGGVNSFGAGGTNAHVVVEEYVPEIHANEQTKEENQYLFTISARSEEALKDLLGSYSQFIAQDTYSLRDICANTGAYRSAFEHRLAIAAKDKQDMIHKIQAFIEGETLAGVAYNVLEEPKKLKLGFVFSGQGPQWYAMGKQLIDKEPLFKSIIQEIEGFFKETAGWSLLEEMSKDEKNSRVNDTRIAQPAIMAIQVALTEFWKKHGVVPEGAIGHSIGEVAAAYCAGALTLQQAVEVIFHRSRGQHAATGKGKMLAVGLTAKECEAIIEPHKEVVSIAAINGPAMVTLAGDTEPLEVIAEKLEKEDVFVKFLRVTVPFHSHHMEPLKDELISSLLHLQPSESKIPLYSTVTGKRENGLHLSSEYWYKNVRQPVYFSDGLDEMLKDGFNAFIELGPHPALSSGAQDLFTARESDAFILPSIRRKEDEKEVFLKSLGSLINQGFAIKWDTIYPDTNRIFDLPKYAWQKKSFWYESKKHKENRLGGRPHPFILSREEFNANGNGFAYNIELNKEVQPFIEDHKVDQVIIFPGTGHLEIATAVAKDAFDEQFGFLEDINFENALFLPDEGMPPAIRLEVYSDEGKYVILSKDQQSEEAEWSKHSNGKINFLGDKFHSKPVNLEEIKERVNDRLPIQSMYNELKQGGLYYGDTFRAISGLWTAPNEVLSIVSLHESLHYGIDKFYLHPAVLDAALHTIFAAKLSNEDEERGIYLPVHIDRYKFHKKPASDKVYTYINVSECTSQFLVGDYSIMDEDGALIAEVQGLRCKYIEGSRSGEQDAAYNGCYEYEWEKAAEWKLKHKPNQNILFISEKADDFASFRNELGGQKASIFHASFGPELKVLGDNKFNFNPANEFSAEGLFDYFKEQKIRLDQIILGHTATVRELALDQHTEAVQEETQHLSMGVLNIFKQIINHELSSTVWLMTQQADQVVAEDKKLSLASSVTFGLGRVLYNEYPMVSVKMADFGDIHDDTEIANFAGIACSTFEHGNDTEIALRGDEVYVKRLQEALRAEKEEASAVTLNAEGSYYKAVVRENGVFDSIAFKQHAAPELKDNEVEISIKASALNFKDVLNALGVLSEESVAGGLVGAQLGLECAGIVSRVGKNVKDHQVGDEVLAFAPYTLAGTTVTPEHCVVKKPSHLTFQEAATITLVYLTAYHCLMNLAQLEEGERVLIHAAAGGVGIAAIKLAQLAGAEIYASAGTEEKRDYLRSLGVKHVYNSRTLDFYDEIMEDTKGEGMDVVLNSLSGKAIAQSLKTLRAFGRFVEIGKTDIYNDMSLHLKRFGENLSYFAVDVDRLMAQKPKAGKRLFQNVIELFEKKEVEVHPFTSFNINQLPDAMQYMSAAKHMGKVVINMEDQQVKTLRPDHLVLDPEKTYAVTGGASGLGLEMAKWLAEKGAKNLALISRSGAKTDYDRHWIEKLGTQGINVMMENLDITNFDQVKAMTDRLAQAGHPIGGIIHGAAVLQDTTIQNMTEEVFARVFGAKAIGAWNLHKASIDQPVDFFVTTSSISSVFGLPGQSNYSSANNFLDKLMQMRSMNGLAGQSVNLGVLGNFAGMSRDGGNVLNVLENQGWLPLTIKQVTAKIERIILDGNSIRMAANIDWKRFRAFFSHLKNDLKFAHLMSDEALKMTGEKSGADSLKDKLAKESPEKAQEMIVENLANALARILGTTADKLDVSKSISAIGLDSLMLNQLRNWIQQKLEINFPLMRIAKGPSIEELGEQLMAIIAESAEEAQDQIDESGISTEEDIEVINEWFIHKKDNKKGDIKLFMFHSMGAGASMFSHFMYNTPENTDVYAVQMPGRENRANEAIFTDLMQMIDSLTDAILPLLDGPFAFYGHSFGGIVAFELAKRLRREFNKEPLYFFSSATMAPQLTGTWKDRDVLKETAISANSEQKLLGLMSYIDDKEFVKQILPIMRKDMPLLMTYDYQQEAPLSCPITVFSAIEDEVTLVDEMKPWKAQTASHFRQELVHGDHWFVSRNKDLIHEHITKDIATVSVEK